MAETTITGVIVATTDGVFGENTYTQVHLQENTGTGRFEKKNDYLVKFWNKHQAVANQFRPGNLVVARVTLSSQLKTGTHGVYSKVSFSGKDMSHCYEEDPRQDESNDRSEGLLPSPGGFKQTIDEIPF